MEQLEFFFTPEPVFYNTGARGFALFGAEHLVSLAVCVALIAALAVRYRSASEAERATQLRVMAGAAVALLVVKDVAYIALGLFSPAFWPLHICNFCEYLALAAALTAGTRAGKVIRGVLLCWAALGCTGALLFPGWSYYTPAATWASLSGFLEHALVVAYVVCAIVAREEGPRFVDVGAAALAAVVCGGVARALNPLVGTNFFFVTRPASTGGPFIWLEQTFPDPWYLPVYLGIACAFWLALSLVWKRFFER